jgi:hypothetical protein
MHSIFEITESSDPSDELSLDLVLLETVKTALGITGTAEDAALAASITRASSVISEVCDRRFGFATAEETFIFDYGECLRPRTPLPLSLYPVAAIDSILQDGLEATEYDLRSSAGLIWFIDWSLSWGTRIVVSYSGGYHLPDGAPGALQQACIQLVSQYRNAGSSSSLAAASGIRSVTHGDATVIYDNSQASSTSTGNSGGVPQIVLDLLGPFKRPAVA